MTDQLHLLPKHRGILQDLLRQHLPDVEVWAYGSRTNGQSHDGSDLGLVLRGPALKEIAADQLGAFDDAVEESNIPFLVDARDWARLPERFQKEIERRHVVVSLKNDSDIEPEKLFDSLPDGWQQTTLGTAVEQGGGQIQTGPFGSQLHASDYVPFGIPSIMPQNIGDNWINPAGIARITPEDANRLKRYSVQQGDIVCSRRGDVERRALIRANEDGWLCGTGCLRVRFGPNGIDPKYASYFLGHPRVREWIVRHAHGATMQNLNTSILSSCPFVIPTKKEQRAIAHILGLLDDKIDLNRRMNETLEAMARAVFKSWFVDFEPVRSKMSDQSHVLALDRRMSSAPLVSPEKVLLTRRAEVGLDGSYQEIAGLFPDRLVESELGEVPEGWRASHVGDCFSLTMGQSPPGSSYNNDGAGLPFFQGRSDFGFRYPETRKFCTSPTRTAQPEDILVSVRAPVGDMNMAWERCCIGRGLATLRHKSGATSYGYYCMLLLQETLRTYEQAGTVFGAINKEQLKSVPMVAPPSKLVAAFESLARPLDDKIRSNIEEMRILTVLRDILLSQLVAGAVRAKDPHGERGSPTRPMS